MPVIQEEWPSSWTTSLPPVDPMPEGPDKWTCLIPRLHVALSSDDVHVSMPLLTHKNPNEPVHAYWEAAYYLLVNLIGWSDPGAGMHWWLRQDMATEGDRRLELLRSIWARDADFPLFVAWLWESGPPASQLGNFEERPERTLDSFSVRGFLDSFQKARDRHAKQITSTLQPYGGNPLHLGNSLGIPIWDGDGDNEPLPPSTAVLIQADERSGKAVLLLEHMEGWRHVLTRAGATLPPLGERSWHVHVVVKPLGWLGEFRRSQVTGIWFQGPHHVHAAGQLKLKPAHVPDGEYGLPARLIDGIWDLVEINPHCSNDLDLLRHVVQGTHPPHSAKCTSEGKPFVAPIHVSKDDPLRGWIASAHVPS